MSSSINVALVGISGYGESYLKALFNPPDDINFKIVGMVDPRPQRSRYLEQIISAGIPLHEDLSSLYASERPDLVMMVTPIHLHAPHTCFALAQGSSVLCEKPAGADINDARKMLRAEQSANAFVAIGYQWSYSHAIQMLKRDIMAGDLGAPIRLKTLVCSPRSINYFTRNDWAGRMRTSDGIPVYDSPANNATSHFLHNMLYVLGPQRELSAVPVSVQAELYRANDIENYDTVAMRCITDTGAELLFYTSHAVHVKMGPVLHYEFEKAVVYYEADNVHGGIVARFHDGLIRRYGDPNLDRQLKIWQAMDAVHSGKRLACGVRGAAPHTLCISAAQASMPQIQSFPDELVVVEELPDGPMRAVTGLPAALVQCYDQAILPFEHRGLDWAACGGIIDVRSPQWSLDGKPAVDVSVAPLLSLSRSELPQTAARQVAGDSE